MKVLITGGFGYLGGRLSQFLAGDADYEILIGSRQQQEAPPWLPHAKVVQMQWDSLTGLEQNCVGVDAIVHLAAMNAQDCAVCPLEALECNGVSTARLLKAAICQGVRRFIHLSTVHVYSGSMTGVISEETCPTNLHPYATSHRAGEDVVRNAHQRDEIEGVVLRLSNAYGAPSHKNANCWMLLMNDLCRQALTSKRMLVKSTGTQRRNFIPMVDACRAIGHFLSLPMEDVVNNVFNVGGEWSPTVWEVACLIRDRCSKLLGFQPELVRMTPQRGEEVVDFDYRLDRLRQAGFQLNSNRLNEIDGLLEFCKVFQ